MFWIILAAIVLIALYIALGIFVDVVLLDDALEDDGLILVWPVMLVILKTIDFFEWFRDKVEEMDYEFRRRRSSKK
jgi:hypothetical protein